MEKKRVKGKKRRGEGEDTNHREGGIVAMLLRLPRGMNGFQFISY